MEHIEEINKTRHYYQNEEKLIGKYLQSIDKHEGKLEVSSLSLEGMKIMLE